MTLSSESSTANRKANRKLREAKMTIELIDQSETETDLRLRLGCNC